MAGSSARSISSSVAMCITAGNTSFDDWLRLTSSLGWIGFLEPTTPPASWMARLAITSLAFMFDCVPEPVWNTTSGNSAVPAAVDHFLRRANDQVGLVRRRAAPSSTLARAAHCLTSAERANDRPSPAEARDADREIVDGALRLRAPQPGRVDEDFTERVLLDPGGRRVHRLASFRECAAAGPDDTSPASSVVVMPGRRFPPLCAIPYRLPVPYRAVFDNPRDDRSERTFASSPGHRRAQ